MEVYYKDKYSTLYCGDCYDIMSSLAQESVDVIVTSPPYNLNIKYSQYKDNKPRNEYLEWIRKIFEQFNRILSKDGSIFLNMGNSSRDPWIDIDVSLVARDFFDIQNRIIWVKSISLDYRTESSYGHFTPLSGDTYLNKTNELIFHFVKNKVKIDRLADGVVYSHPSNFTRWKDKKEKGISDKERMTRCRGNSWFIDYPTRKKKDKCGHPAIFPLQVPLQCIKLHGIEKKPVVLDPFVGIGTTSLAAKILGLNSIGIDIDISYLNCAKTKLQSYKNEQWDNYELPEINKKDYIDEVKKKHRIE